MSEEGILKKIDDIWNYCEEIDNHLSKEEQTGYKMLPDILYIQKEVRNLQQKVEQLENIKKEIKEYIEKNVVCCKNSDMLVELNANDLLNILNKGSEKDVKKDNTNSN